MIEAAKVAVLLLAAGRSERFGSDKLLATIAGEPVAVRTAGTLLSIEPGTRIAVCRGEGGLAARLEALGFEIAFNPDPARGLSSSLALGIERAVKAGADAALVALADMPFVTHTHLSSLLRAFDSVEASIVASTSGFVAMPPVLFDRRYFLQLRGEKGDVGARDLLAGARLVPAHPDELADIDRPEDMRRPALKRSQEACR